MPRCGAPSGHYLHPWRRSITKGLQERMREFDKLDDAQDIRNLLSQVERRPPADVTFDEDTEQMLPELFGGLSIALARSFRVIDPTLESPSTQHGIGHSPCSGCFFEPHLAGGKMHRLRFTRTQGLCAAPRRTPRLQMSILRQGKLSHAALWLHAQRPSVDYFSTGATGPLFDRRQHLPLFKRTRCQMLIVCAGQAGRTGPAFRIRTTRYERRGGFGADKTKR